MLTDNHGRPINYLRLAVTDRCNLRCLYCMPAEGIHQLPRKELLSFEEIERLLAVFSKLGITKLRLTGGEPFLRKDFMQLVERIVEKKWFDKIAITTNGTLTAPFVKRLSELKIHSVNLSLDTFNRERFVAMARRDDFDKVMHTFELLLAHGITTRINAVIMDGKNEEDIYELAMIAKEHPVDVRFIEEMPFNGVGDSHAIKWNYKNIVAQLRQYFPSLEKLTDEPNSTSYNYRVVGFKGNMGVIAAYSRTFCGTCNRIRLTPKGVMKTCLYDSGVLDLRDMLRSGSTDREIESALLNAIQQRKANGWDAESARINQPVSESMAAIGG